MCAIHINGVRSITIDESYFENNGYNPKIENSEYSQNSEHTIVMDLNTSSIDIHSNIFRSNKDESGAIISI